MSHWISTKDRLPDKDGKYLTAHRIYGDLVGYEIVDFGKVKKGKWFYYFDEGLCRHRCEDVDAWMPIEPYTGAEDNKSDRNKAAETMQA